MMRATIKIEPDQTAHRYQTLMYIRALIGDYLRRRENNAPNFGEGGRRVSAIRGTRVESPGISHLGESLDLVVEGKEKRVREVAAALMSAGIDYAVDMKMECLYAVEDRETPTPHMPHEKLAEGGTYLW